MQIKVIFIIIVSHYKTRFEREAQGNSEMADHQVAWQYFRSQMIKHPQNNQVYNYVNYPQN